MFAFQPTNLLAMEQLVNHRFPPGQETALIAFIQDTAALSDFLRLRTAKPLGQIQKPDAEYTDEPIAEPAEEESSVERADTPDAVEEIAVPRTDGVGLAAAVLAAIRNGERSYESILDQELPFVFEMATIATEEEIPSLQSVLTERMTPVLFQTGWAYCQQHPDDPHAVLLFVTACDWMTRHDELGFAQTFVGRIGLPWDDLYERAVQVIRIEHIPLAEVSGHYGLQDNTTFCRQLYLFYFARCEKAELQQNESLLARLIETEALSYVRPALRNYTALNPSDEMSPVISEAIANRLSRESSSETMGLSPALLQRLRTGRYNSLLQYYFGSNLPKHDLYVSMQGRLRNIRTLEHQYLALYFGDYVVVDCSRWPKYAYAYLPSAFSRYLAAWSDNGYSEDFWPAVDESNIPSARDVVLSLKRVDTARLSFTGFDLLYTRDLLSGSR